MIHCSAPVKGTSLRLQYILCVQIYSMIQCDRITNLYYTSSRGDVQNLLFLEIHMKCEHRMAHRDSFFVNPLQSFSESPSLLQTWVVSFDTNPFAPISTIKTTGAHTTLSLWSRRHHFDSLRNHLRNHYAIISASKISAHWGHFAITFQSPPSLRHHFCDHFARTSWTN